MNNLNLNLEVPLLLTILALLLFVYLSAQKSTFKAICYFLLAGAIILLLFGCGTQRYCQPSKKSKDYARITEIHKEDIIFYVKAKMYQRQYHANYKCLPDSFKIGKLVKITGWQKI